MRTLNTAGTNRQPPPPDPRIAFSRKIATILSRVGTRKQVEQSVFLSFIRILLATELQGGEGTELKQTQTAGLKRDKHIKWPRERTEVIVPKHKLGRFIGTDDPRQTRTLRIEIELHTNSQPRATSSDFAFWQ